MESHLPKPALGEFAEGFADEDHPVLRAVRELHVLPSVSDVVVGHDGTTWLRWPDTMADEVRWEVLDEAGEPVRTFELDRRLRIVAADGDQVWATRLGPVSGTTALVTLRVEGAEVADPP